MTWKLSRCDPEPPDAPTRWQVGFDVTDAGGRTVHIITTVYAADLETPSRAAAIARARRTLRKQTEASH